MVNDSINEIKKLLFDKIDYKLYGKIEDLLEDIQILVDIKDGAIMSNTLLIDMYKSNKPLDGIPLTILEQTIERIGKDKPTRRNRK